MIVQNVRKTILTRKYNLTVTINKNVLEKARKHNINISSFLEIRLNEYIALLEGKVQKSNEEVFDKSLSKKDYGLSRARVVLQERLLWVVPQFWGQLKVQSFHFKTLLFSLYLKIKLSNQPKYPQNHLIFYMVYIVSISKQFHPYF